MTWITPKIATFLESRRVAYFASVGANATPHVVPVCYAFDDSAFYFSVDEKPKTTTALKRLRNIEHNAQVSIVVDSYDEDWSRLAWVMLFGRAEILQTGDEHVRAQSALRDRYPQLRSMAIEKLPVVATRVERVNHWGRIDIV